MSNNIVKITKFKKKAKSHVGFLSFLLVVAIICFFLTSPIFAIDKITVSGNKNITSEEIISTSGIVYGQNIMKIDKMFIRSKLSQIPYLKDVTVSRTWPNQINMSVSEKKSVAEVGFYGSKLLIDEDGFVLEVITDNSVTNLVELVGISASQITTGSKLECYEKEKLESYLEILKILNNNDMLNKVRKVDTKEEQYLVHLVNGHVTNLGENTENLQYKILLLKEIIARETNSVYIDLSDLDMIVTKPVWGMFDENPTEDNNSARSDILEE